MGCKACDKKEGLTREQQSLLTALTSQTEPAAAKELATRSGLDPMVVSCGLKALKNRGYIASPVRCRYAITDLGKTALT